MASSSGNSSKTSGSEEDLVDLRKRKRMQSNRESARKSRMRKQKHLDDLTGQISQMKKDNAQILATISATTPQFVRIEAENSVLRAQMDELSQRLDYLNEIMNLMNNESCIATDCAMFEFDNHNHNHNHNHNQHDLMSNPWELMYVNQQQPIMAAAEDMLQYY